MSPPSHASWTSGAKSCFLHTKQGRREADCLRTYGPGWLSRPPVPLRDDCNYSEKWASLRQKSSVTTTLRSPPSITGAAVSKWELISNLEVALPLQLRPLLCLCSCDRFHWWRLGSAPTWDQGKNSTWDPWRCWKHAQVRHGAQAPWGRAALLRISKAWEEKLSCHYLHQAALVLHCQYREAGRGKGAKRMEADRWRKICGAGIEEAGKGAAKSGSSKQRKATEGHGDAKSWAELRSPELGGL